MDKSITLMPMIVNRDTTILQHTHLLYYKTDINMLKDLINDCGEFNEKTNLKNKWKPTKQSGGNHFIAVFKN